jgi:hypothetical protein
MVSGMFAKKNPIGFSRGSGQRLPSLLFKYSFQINSTQRTIHKTVKGIKKVPKSNLKIIIER